jgi:hypothetical protein
MARAGERTCTAISLLIVMLLAATRGARLRAARRIILPRAV